MYAARGTVRPPTVPRFVYALPLFVGEAYMPPGRGLPRVGFAGKPTVTADL